MAICSAIVRTPSGSLACNGAVFSDCSERIVGTISVEPNLYREVGQEQVNFRIAHHRPTIGCADYKYSWPSVA